MPHNHCHIHGEHWPSVTEITGSQPKPWLDRWKEKHGWKAVKKFKLANLIGTEFHRCAELAVKRKPWTTTCRRVQGMMKSLLAWPLFDQIEAIETELKVWNEEYKYQGTLDLICKIGRKWYIIDWKSGSGIYSDMDLQLVAYAKAYEERTKRKIKTGFIVLVSKDKPAHTLTAKEFNLTKTAYKKFIKLRLKLPEVIECDETEDIVNLP